MKQNFVYIKKDNCMIPKFIKTEDAVWINANHILKISIAGIDVPEENTGIYFNVEIYVLPGGIRDVHILRSFKYEKEAYEYAKKVAEGVLFE